MFFRIMKPEGEEAKELEEIVAKRQKRGKVDDEKPLEEKSIFHSMLYCKIFTTYIPTTNVICIMLFEIRIMKIYCI